MTIGTNVLDGPGLSLLLELEQRGFDLAVRHGELWVRPADRLSATQQAKIHQHWDALVTLVRICDDGVQERLAAFKLQRRKAPAGAMPDFVFRRGTPYDKGVCFSCGTTLPKPEFGRCWRCSLAWRLAAGVPIPAEQAAVYDEARVVA